MSITISSLASALLAARMLALEGKHGTRQCAIVVCHCSVSSADMARNDQIL